jgi:hypothetical protein
MSVDNQVKVKTCLASIHAYKGWWFFEYVGMYETWPAPHGFENRWETVYLIRVSWEAVGSHVVNQESRGKPREIIEVTTDAVEGCGKT